MWRWAKLKNYRSREHETEIDHVPEELAWGRRGRTQITKPNRFSSKRVAEAWRPQPKDAWQLIGGDDGTDQA
jgi:hypothetical protein